MTHPKNRGGSCNFNSGEGAFLFSALIPYDQVLDRCRFVLNGTTIDQPGAPTVVFVEFPIISE